MKPGKNQMLCPLLSIALLALTIFPAVSATEWTEKVFLVDEQTGQTFGPGLPQPRDSWKLYSSRKISRGEKNAMSETLEGAGAKVRSWFIGDYVILINPDGRADIYSKAIFQADPGSSSTILPEVLWIKDLEPVKTFKQGDQEILVYQSVLSNQGAVARTAWILKESRWPLALVEGRTVTLYELSKRNAPEPSPNPAEIAAINAAFELQRKNSQYWKLPQ